MSSRGRPEEFKVYVGNIPYAVSQDELAALFQKNIGNVLGFNLVLDRDTQRPNRAGIDRYRQVSTGIDRYRQVERGIDR